MVKHMRISAKGRYGLAAMLSMAANGNSGDPMTVSRLSRNLDISKIYLEQVFALLKKAGLVRSIKGAQGGYRLARPPEEITALEILSELDTAVIERAGPAANRQTSLIDQTIHERVFDPLDRAVAESLERVNLLDLLDSFEQLQKNRHPMYYI